MTVNAPVETAPVNLMIERGLETDDFTGWALGGNSQNTTNGPEIFITNAAESGSYAAAMGSVNSDGTLSQTVQTTAGQQYTLSFWLENQGGDPTALPPMEWHTCFGARECAGARLYAVYLHCHCHR